MSVFRRIAAALTASVTALAATGCSFKLSYETHRQIYTSDTISFSWWGSDLRSDYTLKGIENFEEMHDGIDVRPYLSGFIGYKENLDALMMSGLEYDVMQVSSSWLAEYSPDGEGFYDLYELSDYIHMNNFSEAELAYGERNGKLNGIPISFDSLAFCYNADILAEYELETPQTWSDLFKCAAKLSDDNITLLEASDQARWLMLTAYEEQLTGKHAFLDEGADGGSCFGVDEVKDMIFMENNLLNAGVISNSGFKADNFILGSSAGELLFISEIEDFTMPLEYNGGNIVVGNNISLPSAKLSGWHVKPTAFYAISKNTTEPEAAAMFVDYLLNDSYMTALQGMEKGVPISRSALEVLDGVDQLSGTIYDASVMTEQRLDLNEKHEERVRYEEFFRLCEMCRTGKMSAENAAQRFVKMYPFD